MKTKVLIFLVSLCAGLVFFMIFGHHPISGDAAQYDAIAWNMASGHGYSLSTEAPYIPTNWREPGYVFFLYLLYKLFGHNLQAVYIAQMFLFAASCVLVFSITKNIFDKRIAKISAFLTALCPTLANYTIILYSESFFIFLLVLSVYSVMKAKDTQSVKWYIVSGIIIGLMTLCKVAMLFFIIPVLLYLSGRSLKILLLFLSFSIPLVLWGARNHAVYGTFNLAGKGDTILLIRAYKAEYSFQQIKKAAVYNVSEYLGSRLFPDPKINARDFQFQDDRRVGDEYRELIRQGKSEAEANNDIRKKAISIIQNHPVGYLREMPLELLKLMQFMYIPSLNEENGIDMLENVRGGDIILSGIKGAYKSLSFIILILAIAGIRARKALWQKEFLILAVILYINIIYAILGGYQRYSVPLIPFYLIFATVGFRSLFKKDVC